MCIATCWMVYLQYRQWYKHAPIKNTWAKTLTVLAPLSGMWFLEDMYEFTEWWPSMVIAIGIYTMIMVIAKWGFTCLRKRGE